MKRWSVVWIAFLGIGCSPRPGSAPEQPAPAPPPYVGPAAQAPYVAPTPPVPPSPPAPPPPALVTCTRGEVVESFARSGDAAIGCMTGAGPAQRDCWRIDARGAVTPLPPSQWPAPDPGQPEGDGTPAVELGQTFVRAPAGLTVKIEPEDEGGIPQGTDPRTIEVCKADRCKRMKAPRPANPAVDSLRFLNVLPDGHTLVLGYSLTMAAERLELLDLDKPAAPPRLIPMPRQRCLLVLDELAGNLLVQTSDCANDGGDRVLMTRSGTRVANLGFQSRHTPYFSLGGNRWLFDSYYEGLVIWDVAKLQRVARAPRPPEKIAFHVAVLDGAIIELDAEGKLTRYDAALKPTPLGQIPRCP